MAKAIPGISFSVGQSSSEYETQGDLNALSIGSGMFLAWMYTCAFLSGSVFFGGGHAQPAGTAGSFSPLLFDSFFVSLFLFLLVFVLTDQRLLKFYVGKGALATATALAVAGTYLAQMAAFGSMPLVLLAGVCMGAGASLLTVLWGTAFARFEFATILLNSLVAAILSICLSLAFSHWVPSPLSSAVLGLLPIASALLLWQFTPLPYYRRSEIPIFGPLPVKRSIIVVRAGIPSLIFGVVIGGLMRVSADSIIAVVDAGEQLIVVASAFLAIVFTILAIAAARHLTDWDMPFRCLMPVVAVGIFCTAVLAGPYGLLASFFVLAGLICLDTLLWFFLSDIAQEFRISPILMFGIGRAFITIGACLGSRLASAPLESIAGVPLGSGSTALLLFLALAVAYALLPRQREMGSLLAPHPPIAVQLCDEPEEDELPQKAPASAEDEEDAGEAKREKGPFQARCEEIANCYLLSRREAEVMFLLAKGHNAAFIQNKLCVSKSTVKTHINHIYRKLDIHTQQELLTMVEQRFAEEADASGAPGSRKPLLDPGAPKSSYINASIFESKYRA